MARATEQVDSLPSCFWCAAGQGCELVAREALRMLLQGLAYTLAVRVQLQVVLYRPHARMARVVALTVEYMACVLTASAVKV